MVLYIMDFMNRKLGNLFIFLLQHLLQVMQGEKQLQHRNESVIIQWKNMVMINMSIPDTDSIHCLFENSDELKDIVDIDDYRLRCMETRIIFYTC